MKKIFFIAITIFAFGVLALLRFSEKIIFQTQISGKKIKVFEKRNLKSIISPHIDGIRVLQIGEVRFDDLRGLGIGFEELKEINSLLFVTDEASGPFIHVFDLQHETDIKIPSGDAINFGRMLGSKISKRDKVKVLHPKSLLISTEGNSFLQKKKMTWMFRVDLDKKTISPIEDANGSDTKTDGNQ